MMKKVYICAPLGGDVKANLERVKRYTRYALMCGTAPVVSHFYALCLDDNKQEEREIGLAAGLGMLWFCDELWVFGDEITEGMRNEINFCKNLNIRMKRINEKDIPVTSKLIPIVILKGSVNPNFLRFCTYAKADKTLFETFHAASPKPIEPTVVRM